MSDMKEREEGVRLKHWVNGNTIKMYDKAYAPRGTHCGWRRRSTTWTDFRTYRKAEGEEDGKEKWLPMRRGIADLIGAEVSEAANESTGMRWPSIDDSATVEELVRRLEQPVKWKGGRVRGLRLFQTADANLLAAISRGEFTINGLRNRDLQALLWGEGAQSSGSAEAFRTSQSAHTNAEGAWFAEEGTPHAPISGGRSRAKSAHRHRHRAPGNDSRVSKLAA